MALESLLLAKVATSFRQQLSTVHEAGMMASRWKAAQTPIVESDRELTPPGREQHRREGDASGSGSRSRISSVETSSRHHQWAPTSRERERRKRCDDRLSLLQVLLELSDAHMFEERIFGEVHCFLIAIFALACQYVPSSPASHSAFS